MKLENLNTPEFLFCEIPLKNGSVNDNRTWVLHTSTNILFEIIALDDLEMVNIYNHYKSFNFNYKYERFKMVVVNDHLNIITEEIIEGAKKFYIDYLKWEDENINNAEISNLN